jgi:hypothetical protein
VEVVEHPRPAAEQHGHQVDLDLVDQAGGEVLPAEVGAAHDARIAIHAGDVDRAGALVERSSAAFPERWWEGYARAAGAELAVVAGFPDAAERLARIDPLAAEHRWGAACLARGHGRLTGDPGAIAEGLAEWDRLDARFERACTLLLMPDREPEGRAELSALGCPPPRPS